MVPAIPSVYTKFAKLLQANEQLRNDILAPNFRAMEYMVNSDGTSGVKLTAAAAVPQANEGAKSAPQLK